MSGEKETIVTLRETEYARLRKAEAALRTVESNLPQVLDAMRRQSEEELRRRLEPLEERQRQYQKAIQQVNAQVRATEVRVAQRLEKQNTEQRKALQEMAGRLRGETRRMMEEQDQRLTNLVKEERETRNRQVNGLQQAIARLENAENQQRQLAEGFIEAAQVLRDFIEKNYRHERFAPGKLAIQRRALNLADGNKAHAPQAALVQAQQAYTGLSDLRLDLEQLEREWEIRRCAALEAAKEVLELAQRNRKCKAMDEHGKEIDYVVEVDYWTDGGLSKIESVCEQIIKQTSDKDSILTKEQLEAIIEQTTPELRKQVETTIQDARMAVLSSQLRTNVADKAVQALENMGFSVQEGCYEHGDDRRGYAAKVKDIDGNEVVVLVTPVEGKPEENKLSIHSFDQAKHSHEELTERAREIADALRHEDLRVPDPKETQQGRPDTRLKDLQEFGKQKQKVSSTSANKQY